MPESRTELNRVLGLPHLVLFGLSYLVPTTILTIYGVATAISGGRLPSAVLVALAAMLFTAYSYGRMARVHTSTGSAYVYAQRSIGPRSGFMVGWTMMLDYLFLPLINYVTIGIYLSAQFPSVPAWAWVALFLTVITLLNVRGIKVVASVNTFIVGAQALFMALFFALSLRHLLGQGDVHPLAPFTGSGLEVLPVIAAAAILTESFLGFDAVTTLAEESRDPRRDIPRAIMLVTLLGGLVFLAAAWFGHMILPGHGFADPDAASLDLMGVLGGPLLTALLTTALIIGACGSALSSQASVARVLYAMGRDGALPRRVFGRLHPRFRTPDLNILLAGLVALGALFLDMETVASFISFGALFAFSAVNLSVIAHFLVRERLRSPADLLRYGLLPGIGLAFTLYLWTNLSGLAFAVGGVWIALGAVQLARITGGFRRRPPVLDFSEQEDRPAEEEEEGAPAARDTGRG
ncbi:APC family permease [Nocardiopsis potens]|uniref:APC family permease n=1 Tax=Nocardiopsis potens TaxID=1246458 RepID=UPI00034A4507|nr:APC family permease [Nocardiopsis potens]